MAIHPGLRCRRGKSPHEAGIAVRQVYDEEMRLLLDAACDDHRLAEVGLSMAGRMRQRHEQFAAVPFPLPHVILDDGVAAGEPVLIAEPLEHPLGRMPLLAMDPAIVLQPAVDDAGEGIQLRTFHRGRSPVSRGNRKRHHLGYGVARNVEMPGGLSLAHPLGTGQSHLPIQVHGENPPTLPAARKGKGGRLLRRPQQGHPAATVADFCNRALGFNLHLSLQNMRLRGHAVRRWRWRCVDIRYRSGASASPIRQLQPS